MRLTPATAAGDAEAGAVCESPGSALQRTIEEGLRDG